MILWAVACQGVDPPIEPLPIELNADAGPDRTVPVGAAVKLDGRDSTGAISYTWDAGDGRTFDEPSPVLIYDQPGNYTAILEVMGSDGATRTDVTRVVAYARPADVPPATSSTILVHEGEVWGVVADGGSVFAANAEGVRHSTPCAQPLGITVSEGVAVLCGGDEPEIRPAHSDPIALPPRSHPAAMVPHPAGFAVSLWGRGEVVTVSPTGDTSIALTGRDPRALVSLDADLVSARFRSAEQAGTLFTSTDPLLLPFDEGPDTDTGNRGVPNLLTLAAAPDGRTLFVAGTLSNTARGSFLDGQAMTHDTTVRAFFSIVDRTDGERVRRQFDDQGVVSALAVVPLGNIVFAAFPGTQTVFALDAYTGDIAGSLLDVGRGIDGMAVSEDGETLYLNATLDREVRAYDVSDLTSLPRLLWSHSTVENDLLPADVLRGKQLFHESGDPRVAEDGYISCATCHPHGDHDGQTWDFTDRGEGLRNTTSMLGRAGMGMGPVHWTGNFDEIQDFEHDIRGPFAGEGLMTDADFAETDTPLGLPKAGLSAELDALAAYVQTLDQLPSSPFDPPPEGEAAFLASGCDTCHPPPLFTDSALDVRHDIGTATPGSGQRLGGPLDGFDTPTLLGVWDSAPYLHDGRASTLTEAISAHESAPTDPETLETLADYLRSL